MLYLEHYSTGYKKLRRNFDMSYLHRASRSCILTRYHIPFVTVVYEEGEIKLIYRCPCIYIHTQELALRSAILFAGLLISNAFGAVCI